LVKAVNKLVLEINNTENEYFEKAIFYIRPEMSCSSKLRSQAQLYLNGISLEKAGKSPHKNKLPFIIGAVIGTVGAGIVSAILLLTGVL
jgi:hypothetical protein